MNKKSFLICLFFLSIACVESYCISNSICFAQRKRSRQIKLERVRIDELARSNFIPYIVEVDDQSISTTYLQDLSNITVEIFNESGESTYRKIVNPVRNGLLLINIEDWANGHYTIYFKNSENNNILSGEFEL